MRRPRRCFMHAAVLLAMAAFACSTIQAQRKSGSDFDAIVKHLKTRYQAKKRGIPFMGLAKFGIRIIKPAGVKSLSVSLFEDLKNTGELADSELNSVMRNSLSAEWMPLASFRQRGG